MTRRRLRWMTWLALASAAALSGCYWDPYTGSVYPYPPAAPYPYGAPPPYPNGAPPYPNGAPPYPNSAPPPGNGPVQQTPLPPP
jgi:hypothetical protein